MPSLAVRTNARAYRAWLADNGIRTDRPSFFARLIPFRSH